MKNNLCFLINAFIFSIFISSCSVTDELRKEDVDQYEKISKNNIPIIRNAEVERFIRFFQTSHRKHFVRWLERSSRYIPAMKRVFMEERLPTDLVYVALIESGFNATAYSRARATGIWQFMPATGKRYGLKVNWWVDERRDPMKSAHAAARYLKDLHDTFGSWYLAIAGYNAGEGKILRAIKKHNTENFWEMTKYRYLKRETKDYIPKFIAAMIIAKDPEKYGFTDLEYQKPQSYEVVEIVKPLELKTVAKNLDILEKELKDLNPELRRWCTPLDAKSYALKVPAGHSDILLANLSTLPALSYSNLHSHRVQYGDSLWKVARAYGVSVDDVRKVNNLSGNTLRVGQSLMIPLDPRGIQGSKQRMKASITERTKKTPIVVSTASGDTQKVVYTVNAGDTLWDISKNFDVSIHQILAWNDVRRNRIRPGDKIELYVKNPPPTMIAD
ncbi:MAG: transglycosylase SLT domain-containing protein [Deltaproteobacteria bacterium]|nr:transglycosylase SLT domain-containing protein [Deltaproteobacteria bacterium]